MFSRWKAYYRPMIARTSSLLGKLLVVAGVAVAALGCDTGGLLVVEHSGVDPDKPKVTGHSANELVSGGSVASNAKYKVVFTVGQPTTNQGVSTSTDQRLNGGLVGAVSGD
jgi:hypothetical protein